MTNEPSVGEGEAVGEGAGLQVPRVVLQGVPGIEASRTHHPQETQRASRSFDEETQGRGAVAAGDPLRAARERHIPLRDHAERPRGLPPDLPHEGKYFEFSHHSFEFRFLSNLLTLIFDL